MLSPLPPFPSSAHRPREARLPTEDELSLTSMDRTLRVARMLSVSTREGLFEIGVLEDRMTQAAQSWTFTAFRSAQERALPWSNQIGIRRNLRKLNIKDHWKWKANKCIYFKPSWHNGILEASSDTSSFGQRRKFMVLNLQFIGQLIPHFQSQLSSQG